MINVQKDWEAGVQERLDFSPERESVISNVLVWEYASRDIKGITHYS